MDFLDFINRLLDYDPRQRMTPGEALRHDFLAPLTPIALFDRDYGKLMRSFEYSNDIKYHFFLHWASISFVLN